ncbi:hypothetical protein NF212_23060 [Parasalinivibrio latis]|uniref:hypothetical protein n=1 Tax=Parasalinivibrio latis TaxID=2952610 RepID=UPI0030E0F125
MKIAHSLILYTLLSFSSNANEVTLESSNLTKHFYACIEPINSVCIKNIVFDEGKTFVIFSYDNTNDENDWVKAEWTGAILNQLDVLLLILNPKADLITSKRIEHPTLNLNGYKQEDIIVGIEAIINNKRYVGFSEFIGFEIPEIKNSVSEKKLSVIQYYKHVKHLKNLVNDSKLNRENRDMDIFRN